MTLELLPLAALIEGRTIVAIAIPLAAIVLAGVITVSAMYFRHQEKRELHETARLALEKGHPLSPELLTEFCHRSS